jgi:molybdopterin-guanine dinucleotide biosynthesis protein A
MPFVTADIFHHLANHIGDAWICVPWYENEHYEPLCGIFSKDCLPDMETFINVKNYKLPGLFLNTNFKALNIRDVYPPLHKSYFFNINSPSDLELANEMRLI